MTTNSPDNGSGPAGGAARRRGSAISGILLAILLAALVPSLTGCLTVAIRDSSGPSAPTPDEESFAEFMDVPYPAIMTLEKDDTYTYTRRDVQAGVVTVMGRMTVDELGAFYDEHLPSHGWLPVAEAQSVKLVSTWTKGSKVLTIIATPIVMAIGGNLRVELWVAAPHTKADLGQRTVYRSAHDGEPLVKTKPVRGGGGGAKKGDISEEDI
jgi:hypothetical protein